MIRLQQQSTEVSGQSRYERSTRESLGFIQRHFGVDTSRESNLSSPLDSSDSYLIDVKKSGLFRILNESTKSVAQTSRQEERHRHVKRRQAGRQAGVHLSRRDARSFESPRRS